MPALRLKLLVVQLVPLRQLLLGNQIYELQLEATIWERRFPNLSPMTMIPPRPNMDSLHTMPTSFWTKWYKDAKGGVIQFKIPKKVCNITHFGAKSLMPIHSRSHWTLELYPCQRGRLFDSPPSAQMCSSLSWTTFLLWIVCVSGSPARTWRNSFSW